MTDAFSLLRNFIDQTEELSFLISPSGEVLHASRAMLSTLKTTLAVTAATPLRRFYTDGTYHLLRNTAMVEVNRCGNWEGEGQLRPLSGEAPIPARLRMFVVRDPHSTQPLCVVVQHALDLDRRRAEEAESLKAALLESSLDPIILVNQEGRIVEFNRAAQRSFGYRREQMLGQKPEDVLFAPEEVETPSQRVERHLNTREGSLLGRRTEIIARRANGELFPAEMAMTISYVASAPLFAFYLRDLTERKQAQQSLEESEARLQSILDNTPAVVYVKALDGRYLLVNRSFETLFHVTRDGLLGLTDFDMFPAEMAEVFRANDRQVCEAARPLVFEELAPHDDGPHTYLSVKFPLLDATGAVASLCGISTDITERIRSEAALRQAKEAAEAASQAKSLFLANMSHEIRTPLNAVIGLTELVLESLSSPEHREYLTMVRNSGESLLSVINDILDFSKIEAGKLDLEQVVFDPRETLGDAMKSLAFRAHSKGLELACHIAPDVPEALVGDPARLRQTIVNLVGNAIKFTDRGQVDLDVHEQTEDRGQGTGDSRTLNEAGVTLHFAVRDTGIGIPAEKQEQIFDAFEQADSSMTRRFGGTGLGLSISRRLIEMMGGRIWLESEIQRGSTFYFTARFGIGSRLAIPAGRGMLAGVPVLVVDDNATSRFILEEMLGNWQMTPTVACDAQQALAQVMIKQKSGDGFPLVLIDAQMPDEDGFALIRRLRAKPGRLGVPIMMLGSEDLPGDIGRCEQLGVPHYLLKPIKQSELLDLLVRIRSQDEADQTPAAEHATPICRLPPLRVLLAEDSPVNQKLALGVLHRHGHTVTVANNGREALELLERETFDVVLMDVQMPEVDGLDATATIRRREQGTSRHVPIVAMTAHAMKGDRERCLDAGMDGYVAKPVRSGELFAVLEQVLSLAGEVEQNRGPTPPAALPREIFDQARILDRMQGDKESLRELAAVFNTECRQTLGEIQRALESHDAASLRRAAHTLQGSARVFLCDPVQQAASALEEHASRNDFEQAHRAHEELRPLVDRLLAALRLLT